MNKTYTHSETDTDRHRQTETEWKKEEEAEKKTIDTKKHNFLPSQIYFTLLNLLVTKTIYNYAEEHDNI